MLGSLSCRNVDAAAHNLRVLHESDGSVARQSAPLGHLEYRWRRALSDLPLERLGIGSNELLFSKKPVDQKRPGKQIRREFNTVLAAADRNPRSRGLAVELSTWLAVDDPSPVIRQMALEELGRAAERLGVQRLEESVDDAEEAEALRLVLTELFESFEDRDAMGFQRGLGELSRVVSSREGAWRALRGLNVLLGAPDRLPGSRADFDAAHAAMQRRCVALGLSDALGDSDDRTRGEALRAAVKLAPARALPLLEDALRVRFYEALAAGLDAARRGEVLPPADRREELESWCELCVRASDLPYGPAAVAAAKALAELAPRLDGDKAPASTLRPEAWILWWTRRSPIDPAGEPNGPGATQSPAGAFPPQPAGPLPQGPPDPRP